MERVPDSHVAAEFVTGNAFRSDSALAQWLTVLGAILNDLVFPFYLFAGGSGNRVPVFHHHY